MGSGRVGPISTVQLHVGKCGIKKEMKVQLNCVLASDCTQLTRYHHGYKGRDTCRLKITYTTCHPMLDEQEAHVKYTFEQMDVLWKMNRLLTL